MINIEHFTPKIGDHLYYVKPTWRSTSMTGKVHIIAIEGDKVITDKFIFYIPNLASNGMPIEIRVGIQGAPMPGFDFDGDVVTLYKLDGGIDV